MINLRICSVFLLIVIWSPLHSIDRLTNQQPLQIDANSIQHNDARAVTKFLGNVVLVRGDLTLKGDSLILNQTEDGLSFGKVMGSPAVFQTRRTVEDRNSTFLLKGNARLVRLENGKIKEEVSGDELSYNSNSEVYKAITEPGETRTRMTVIPKPSDE
jgi:lipopolysaccharide export system protein LptA